METVKEYVLKVERLSAGRAGRPVLTDISFVLEAGDHLAITGASGSGKTTLGLALTGKTFYKGVVSFGGPTGDTVVWVEQQHRFKHLSHTTDFYYQQRFNSFDSEQTQTVEEALQQTGGDIDAAVEILQIGYLLKKPLIQLSNGENKKLQIVQALLRQPSMLIMDQPFTGLDITTRQSLHRLVNELAAKGITVILITSPDEIPDCMTKVLVLDKGRVQAFTGREAFAVTDGMGDLPAKKMDAHKRDALLKLLPGHAAGEMIAMHKVSVRYGDKHILQDIDWRVNKGERWLLTGANGAGKSTLLSLVTADNPQAYANDIYLFGRKRGSGESIWDIKKQIGFVSPELHLFFDAGSTVFETIASGLFDTIGLFRRVAEADAELVREWMSLADLQHLEQRRLYELPAGEQRVVLLIRALVKNPPLLILDEPCQGLDDGQQQRLLELIDAVCVYGGKAMVFVTHYSRQRPACIDHYLVLDNGRIAECGKIELRV